MVEVQRREDSKDGKYENVRDTEEYINNDDKIEEVDQDLEQTKMSGEMQGDSDQDDNEMDI